MSGKNKIASFEKKQNRWGYIFCLPFMIGFVLLVAYPLLKMVLFSFEELSVGTVTYETEYVGWQHYHRILFVDPDFRKTVVASLGEMAVNVPVAVLFSFFIASILNQKFIGRTVFRACIIVEPYCCFIHAASTIRRCDGSFVPGSTESISFIRSRGNSE